MTLRNTAINCALFQSLWTWRTLLSLILLSRFLSHVESSDGNQTTTKKSLSSPTSTNATTTAPEKINIKSLLGSSEAVQKLLQNNKAFLPFVSSEASSNPQELNKLMARFKPKQGRFDPALIDMLSNFENFGGSIPNIFGNGNSHEFPQTISRRHPTSTEENAILWSTTVQPDEESNGVNKRKVIPYVRNRFSSKFRNKTVEASSNRTQEDDEMNESPRLQHAPLLSDSDVMVNETHGIPPFDHITDPNLRNHRLYEWEFENYKNFTHIDREEDLLADESEPVPSVQIVEVVAPSSTKPPPVLTTTLIPGGWIPKVGGPKSRFPDFDDSRPTSASEEYAVDSEDTSLSNVIPGVYVKLPSGSETDKSSPTARPREPLRESSTENRILSYEDTSRRNDYRRRQNKDRSDESPSKNLRDDFRPSPPELSPPVFVDPDQDFFTSTIRNPSDERFDELEHVPGYRSPSKKRRKPVNRLTIRHKDDDPRKSRYETSTRFISSEEDYYKRRDRARLELNRDEKPSKPNRDRDVPPRPDSFDERDREPPRLEQSDLKRPITSQESHLDHNNDFKPFRKSDRILTHDEEDRKSASSKPTLIKPKLSYSNEAQGTEHRPYYHSPYGPASNEFEFSNTRERERDRSEDYHNENNAQRYNTNSNNHYNDYESNNYPQTQYSNTDQGSYYNNNPEVYNNHNQQEYSQAHHEPHSDSGDHSNAPRDQYYAGGYEHQYNHPFAEDSNSYAPSAYGIEESPSSSWPKTYYILGGLVVASALLAFLVPTVLGSMGKRGKVRNDLEDDLTTTADDFVDENTSTSPGAFGSASNTHTSESDPTADTDLWTEIKGVYNDIVNIVRGDYGGIVDKLTGNGSGVSLKGSNKKKDKKNQDGPNIVYREVEEAEDDEKNDGNDLDAFENDHRRGKMRHRKGIESSSTSNSISSSSSTTEKSNHHHRNDHHHKKNSNNKSKTLTSSINYMVRNHNDHHHGGYLEETSRAVSSSTPRHNDSLAGFYLGKTLLPSSSTPTVAGTSNYPSSTEGFMGEWAKVQLIGS